MIQIVHTESIFAFDVSSLASRDEENIAVVPMAKFGEWVMVKLIFP